MKKRILSLALTLVMLAGLLPTVSAETAMHPATNLRFEMTQGWHTQILRLVWDAPADEADIRSYALERSTDGGFSWVPAISVLPMGTNSFSLNSLHNI